MLWLPKFLLWAFPPLFKFNTVLKDLAVLSQGTNKSVTFIRKFQIGCLRY